MIEQLVWTNSTLSGDSKITRLTGINLFYPQSMEHDILTLPSNLTFSFFLLLDSLLSVCGEVVGLGTAPDAVQGGSVLMCFSSSLLLERGLLLKEVS